MRAIRRSPRRALPWLFLAAVAALTLCMDVYVARNILDGDTSDIIHVARLIAETGDLFPTDVYYSTELKLVDSQLLFSLFFHFTQDWSLVRVCGTVLMQGLYALSMLFLCRSARLSWDVSAVSAAFLLLPFSTPYARVVLYHLYYINYLSEAFLMLGLTLRLMEPRGWRKDVLPGAALAALWVFVGTNGVRHMMILGAPMLALAGLELLRELWRRRGGRAALPLRQTGAARLAAVMLLSCACFLAGFLVYRLVLLDWFSVRDSSSVSLAFFAHMDSLGELLQSWLIATGARYTQRFQLGRSLPALISFGCLLCASCVSVARRGDARIRVMQGMLAASALITTLVFLLDTSPRTYTLYYVPVVAFAFPTLAGELAAFPRHGGARRVLIALTCACLLFQGAYTARFMLVNHEEGGWEGLGMKNLRSADTSRAYADYMLENGYTHALAPYWHANVMMELTDGALTVSGVNMELDAMGAPAITQYRWGTLKSPFYKENLPPRLLLFVEQNDALALEQAHPDWRPVKTFTSETPVSVYEITPDDITYEPHPSPIE